MSSAPEGEGLCLHHSHLGLALAHLDLWGGACPSASQSSSPLSSSLMRHSGKGRWEPERGLGRPLPAVQVECLPWGWWAQQGSPLFLPPSPSLGKWAPGASAPLKAIPRLWAGMRGGGCQPRAWTQPFSKEKNQKVKKKKKRKKKLIYTESYKAWLGEGALLSESTGHQSLSVSCLATPPPQFWSCNNPTSPPQVGTIPHSCPGQMGVMPTPYPLLVPTVDPA